MLKKKKGKALNKIDKLVTGVIIWSAIASIFGLSKTQKWKKITNKVSTKSKNVFWKMYEKFSNIMSFIFRINK